MGTHEHANLVLLEEFVNDIRSVAHDVVLSLWVTHGVSLHAQYLV